MPTRISLLIFSLLALTSPAVAKPTIRLVTATGLNTSFPDGKVSFLPLPLVVNVVVGLPLNDRWGWGVGVGLKTRLDAFNPAPQVVTGPSVRLSDRVSLSLTALYRYTPNYGKGPNHLFAVAVGPGIAITPEIGLAIAVGTGATFAQGVAIPELDIIPSASFKLW